MALCAIDNEKIPVMDNRHKLKDGAFICNKHFKEAGLKLTDNSKDYTTTDIVRFISELSDLTNKLSNGKANKSDRKAYTYLVKRNLNTLNPNTFDDVKNIANDLAGNNLIKTGMALSFSNGADQVKIGYLSALVNQNWILMKQNQEIIELLKKDK